MNTQITIDEYLAANPHFNGADYSPQHDQTRLKGQIKRIFDLMKDGRWRTLGEIEAVTGDPQASISAQLRHLKKPRFGGHFVEYRPRSNRCGGLFEYRMVPRQSNS